MKNCIEFQNSFFHWLLLEQNSIGRFSIAARCRLTDKRKSFHEDYFLLKSVMAGNVYGDHSLIKDPSYMFIAIFSGNDYKIIRNYHQFSETDDTCGKVKDRFKKTNVHIQSKACRELMTFKQILEATNGDATVNATIQFSCWEGYDFVMEFPVHHINVQTEKSMFQVETGPILMPARARKASIIDSLEIGYVAFNTFLELDYIILSPRSIASGSKRSYRDYSDIGHQKAKIKLLAHVK